MLEIVIRRAVPEDAAACIALRGETRDNAISGPQLAALGVTAPSWAADMASGAVLGWVALEGAQLLGFGFGDSASGEVLVLALHPRAEGLGIGKRLLERVAQDLRSRGHERLFLGCSADPKLRSYGFYRHLGWKNTGLRDSRGDELLEYRE